MNNLNSVIIEGDAVVDPVSKRMGNGDLICTFDIESTRNYKEKEEGPVLEEKSVFTIEAKNNTASAVMKFLKKGNGVRVVGRLKQVFTKDAMGNQSSTFSIRAEHVEFRGLKIEPRG